MSGTKKVPKLNLELNEIDYQNDNKDLYKSNSSRDFFKLNTVKFRDEDILNEIKLKSQYSDRHHKSNKNMI